MSVLWGQEVSGPGLVPSLFLSGGGMFPGSVRYIREAV